MPQFLMAVWHDDDYPDLDTSDPDVERMVTKVGAFNAELEAAGAWVFGGGLRTASTAKVVRAVDGAVSTTDGPYPETKEQMGGFWVIDVADLDAALAWAAKATIACERPIEVRAADG
jgi:hypothetical protein